MGSGAADPVESQRKPILAGAGPGLQNQRAAANVAVGSTPTGFRQSPPWTEPVWRPACLRPWRRFSMISATQMPRRSAPNGQPVVPSGDRTRSDFASVLSRHSSAARGRGREVATSRRPAAETGGNLPSGATTPPVVASPFNPLGLPVATSAAPTVAEVAADPARFAGTSFDPNRAIVPLAVRMRQLDERDSAARWAQDLPARPDPAAEAARRQRESQPPAGARPTNDPNVFVLGQSTIWTRPGTAPLHPTSEDYQRWLRSTFGA